VATAGLDVKLRSTSFSSAATSTLQYHDSNEHKERMTTMFGGGGDATTLSTNNNNKSMKSSQSSPINAVNFPMLTRLCRSQFTLLAMANPASQLIGALVKCSISLSSASAQSG